MPVRRGRGIFFPSGGAPPPPASQSIEVPLLSSGFTVPSPTVSTFTPGGQTSGADAGAGAACNEAVFYIDHSDFRLLDTTKLGVIASWGVKGIGMSIRRLIDHGGNHDFSPNPTSDAKYDLQKTIQNNNIVQKCRDALGPDSKLYIIFYTASTAQGKTPFYGTWFEDDPWNNLTLPAIRRLADGAQFMGFDGLWFDMEPRLVGGSIISWNWNFTGNLNNEATTRDKVKDRGEQIGTEFANEFPNIDLVAYWYNNKAGWVGEVERLVNGDGQTTYNSTSPYDNHVIDDLWDGIMSSASVRSFRVFQSIFYKTFHRGPDWDNAFTWDINRMHAQWSQTWDNWHQRQAKTHVAPFAWINGTDLSDVDNLFSRPRSQSYVNTQLQEFRNWGGGKQYGIFHFDTLFPTGAMDPMSYLGLLTTNEKTIDTDASGWEVDANCTLARVTTPVFAGSGALRLTPGTVGGMRARLATRKAVTAGKGYIGRARFRAGTVTANCRLLLRWYNAPSGGSLLSTTTGSSTKDTTTGWTLVQVSGMAPAGATHEELVLDVLETADGQLHYADDMDVSRSFSYSDWSGRGGNNQDYTVPLLSASTAGTIDTTPPTLVRNAPSVSGGNATITGNVVDTYGVKAVLWFNDTTGTSGSAPMTWVIVSGNSHPTGVTSWRMDYVATVPLQVGTNRVRIKTYDTRGRWTQDEFDVVRP